MFELGNLSNIRFGELSNIPSFNAPIFPNCQFIDLKIFEIPDSFNSANP